MQITVPAQGSLDEQGRLLHEGDVLAQLVLAANNLEARLAEAGLAWADVTHVRVETLDPAGMDDALVAVREHLLDLGAQPALDVVPVPALPLPGMAVAVGCRAATRSSTGTDERTVMTLQLQPARPAEQLRARCPGFVHLPGDPAYDTAATPWNVAVVQRPAAVALPRTPEQVAAVVAAAAGPGGPVTRIGRAAGRGRE